MFCRGSVLGEEMNGTVKVKLIDFGEERTVALERYQLIKQNFVFSSA